MTSKLKCPFCQQELRNCCAGVIYTCSKPDSCPHEQCYGSKELWQALIQAKRDLEQCEHKDNLQQQLNANNNQIQENYKQIVEIDERIIENLEKDLQTAVQALKDARIFAETHCIATAVKTIDKALEQITHDNSEKTNSVEHKE